MLVFERQDAKRHSLTVRTVRPSIGMERKVQTLTGSWQHQTMNWQHSGLTCRNKFLLFLLLFLSLSLSFFVSLSLCLLASLEAILIDLKTCKGEREWRCLSVISLAFPSFSLPLCNGWADYKRTLTTVWLDFFVFFLLLLFSFLFSFWELLSLLLPLIMP